MIVFRRKGLSGAVVTLGLMGSIAVARAQNPDSTLESTERLFRRAFDTAKETPLAQSANAGEVVTALRSTRDLNLLPLFDKLLRQQSH